MPIDIRSLQRKGVEVHVPFYGEDLVVTYDPLQVCNPLWRDEVGAESQKLAQEYADKAQIAMARTTPDNLTRLSDDRIKTLARERGLNTDHERDKLIKELNNARVKAEKEPEMSWADRDRPAAYLAAQYIKSWDIEDDGKPVPISADVFLDGTLPSQLAREIVSAIRSDADALGKTSTSNNGRSTTS